MKLQTNIEESLAIGPGALQVTKGDATKVNITQSASLMFIEMTRSIDSAFFGSMHDSCFIFSSPFIFAPLPLYERPQQTDHNGQEIYFFFKLMKLFPISW